jgi:putative transposase
MREWEAKLAPLLGEALRKRRHGAVGHSWYVDDTYVRVQGQWQYLYRAIDRDGQLVDVRLGATRDLAAAEACFRSAWTVAGVTPERITTAGAGSSGVNEPSPITPPDSPLWYESWHNHDGRGRR